MKKRARTSSSMQQPRTPTRPKVTDKSSETPRSARGDVGSIGQNLIRSDVAQQMADEMLDCGIDGFLRHYAPFCPIDDSIDSALGKLKHDNFLTKDGWQGLSGDDIPSKSDESEARVFGKLKPIVGALTAQECHGTDSRAPRKCNFNYEDCDDTQMVGEIAGGTFRIDAYFSPASSPPLYTSEKVVVSQVAVAAEFKKRRKDFYDNRLKLVSAANHIMNDDPRRMWMYGITIEGEAMSVWYFSRSHSVKSKAFDFTQDPRKFVTVLLSLLFATDVEMGFDPTVHRIMYKGKIRDVYELAPKEGGTLYFRTIKPIFNPRIACITGGKTRVWRAIQVTGPDGSQDEGDREVILKDVWLDKGSPKEKGNQDSIYKKLHQVQEKNEYGWIDVDYRQRVVDALANMPDSLPFMRILHDAEGVTCKERLAEASPDRTILSPPEHPVFSSKNVSSFSIQNKSSNSATSTSRDARMNIEQTNHPERRYMAKTQYRLVYAEVGYALHDVQSIDKAFKAINDMFIALVLLFLAGWVHRDISTGNIIVVENEGSLRGLLSDFEYAKVTSSQGSSSDPKTGTPYFMPMEIHRGRRYVSRAQPSTVEEMKQNMRSDIFSLPKLPKAILRYTSNHDQESLMWVALWIVYGLVDYEKAEKIRPQIFANTRIPTPKREEFFTQDHSLQDEEKFREAFHPGLGPDYPRRFDFLRREFYAFCKLNEPQREDYHNFINSLSIAFDSLLAMVIGKAKTVPLMVRSGSENQANDEVERNNTECTPHSMTLRSHVRNSGPPRRRFPRE